MYRYNKTSIILKISIAVLFIIGMVLECSCERSEEPEKRGTGYITCTLRWDSVVAVPRYRRNFAIVSTSEGGPMIQTDGNANGITLFLPPDKYNVLVFNYDAKNIGFRNMSKFEEAEAYISSLKDLEACQDEVIPLYVATIRSVEVEGDTEKHKELTLSPFFLSKDSSLNLSNERKGIANNINGLKKTSIR